MRKSDSISKAFYDGFEELRDDIVAFTGCLLSSHPGDLAALGIVAERVAVIFNHLLETEGMEDQTITVGGLAKMAATIFRACADELDSHFAEGPCETKK